MVKPHLHVRADLRSSNAMKALALAALVAACGNPGLAPISYRAESALLCLPRHADPRARGPVLSRPARPTPAARTVERADAPPAATGGKPQPPPPAPTGIDCFYI